MGRGSSRLIAVCAALAATLGIAANTASAAPPAPRLKPERPALHLDLLSSADMTQLRAGLRAASRGDWESVRRHRAAINDATASKILLWRTAQSNSDADFATLAEAVRTLEGWPRNITMRDQAEAAIGESGLSASQRLAWFGAHPPVSGEGKIAHAEALLIAGRTRDGVALLREAWRTSLLSKSVQTDIERRYRSRLRRVDHEARVDFLLWHGYRSSASALLSRLSTGQRRLAEARIALMARRRGVDRAVAAVPSSLRNNPGLLYERARWRRRSGQGANALPLMLKLTDEVPHFAALKIWTERRIHIGRALKAGAYDDAYTLATAHGLRPGGLQYADAEWLSGWLALRKLDDPTQARRHFDALAAHVSTPISRARALYWQGRTAETRQDVESARAYYAQAAALVMTYYGQLARERFDAMAPGAPPFTLPAATRPSAGQRLAFHAREDVRALRMLAALDEPALFRAMSFHLDDRITDPAEVALLAEIARAYGEPDIAVRGGKAGVARGALHPDIAYPVIALPRLPRTAPEKAFLLALMRQESEFEPRAISRAGARGVMQLMPSTARLTARSIGESYRRNWLTDDPDYNITIGAAHLEELSEEFDGSYVLMAAAYNAGAGRAWRWVRDYGDPRDEDVDVVDWVESIPFSETRNYVQRVMEAMTIYRARLNGGKVMVRLSQDLSRGQPG